MAETFGEADVILRVRLDELQRQLDESERMVEQSTQRVHQAQAQAQQDFAQASDGSTRSGYSLGVMLGFVAARFGLFRRAALLAGRALLMIPVVAKAASIGLIALASGGVAVVALGVGLLAEQLLRAERGIVALGEAAQRLDGSRDRILEFADALARIPILGRLAATAFLVMKGETEAAQESFLRLVARIEDGQVKVGLLGRAVNGLVNLDRPGIVSRLLGFDTDLVGQIDEANRKIREMQRTMAEMAQAGSITGQSVGQAEDFARDAERQRELAGAEGVERVILLERHGHEDKMRQLDEEERQRNRMHADQVAAIRQQMEEEKIGRREGNALIEMLESEHQRRVEERQRLREQGEADLAAAIAQRIQLAREEADEQARIERIEAQRTAAAEHLADQSLAGQAASMRLRAAGEDFEAQRVELDLARHQAILTAMVENANEERLDLIRDFYDARAELIDAREQQQLAREQEIAARRAEAEEKALQQEKKRQEDHEFDVLQTNERLRSQILQTRMQMAGQDVEARQEAIRQRFQEQIDRMEREGNQIGADLARQLRDLQIEAAGQQDRGRQAEFQQVVLSRVALGGVAGMDEQRIEREQLAMLKRVEKNTRSPQPAVAT